MSSIYEVEVDPNAENEAHSLALSLIGHNKSVLEVGCASGYFTKVLAQRGCDVVGMELDPKAAAVAEQWAERVVVGNIDDADVWNGVKDESFDVVVLGDVLEHLRDPLTSLRHAARKLKPSGFVVTSLPNIAHGDVRISLLQGRFQYRDTGLLDRTHVRFFTLDSARELLDQAGLVLVDTKRVVIPLFHSELDVRREDVHPKTLDELLTDPEAESYQFVMKAVLDNGTRTLTQLSQRITELSDRVHHETVRTALLRAEFFGHPTLREQLDEHQRYVKALEGHVSGLEHNIEVLADALATKDAQLVASEARYGEILRMRSVRMTAPLRRLRTRFRRSGKDVS